MRYETSFAGSEDPLSEGGVWQNGGYPNNNRLKKVSGIACGVAVAAGAPWDPAGYVLGFANDNALVQGTIYIDPSIGNCNHEFEILLRASDNGTYIRAYEVNCQYTPSTGIGVLDLYRWFGDGNADEFGGGGAVHENNGVIASGDVFAAKAVGDVVSIYWNGILQYEITDSSASKIATGSGCGLGVFRRNTANGGCDDTFDTSNGYTHFLADDGLGGSSSRRLSVRGA